MRLSPKDDIHGEIAFTGVYELELTRRIASHARSSESGWMIDVGANYGYFALLWAAASPQNRVIAFEASPSNHAPLRENVTINNLEDQIEVRALAAGRESGRLQFSLGDGEQTGWGGFSVVGASRISEVSVVTLDSSVPDHVTLDLLKIDVEGADAWVLYGAEKLLARKRIRHVYFEQNKERMASLGIMEREPIDYLAKMGYTAAPISDPRLGLVEYYASPR